ncbi:bromodomain and extraterminal domain protein 10 [Actinidia rufa]|uniref:Bromodomain and extraterminal domain protein 10 n=1 Tax=Actinidia rufa TaxID=165716 RepID=A0A7J0FPE5_9ERIC|nr:bromodomain and extraterminal domain protein 10 [Actinidia rufa]
MSPAFSVHRKTLAIYIITTENIVKKKPKVKITSKCIEANPETGSRVFLKTEIMNNKRGRDVLESKNKKSETNKQQKSAIPSSGKMKLYAADNLKVKSSAMGTKKPEAGSSVFLNTEILNNKRGRDVLESKNKKSETNKNPKIDPVKLHIPDYFSIISEPMDLGTINTKLANYPYSSVEEFAVDVRLTFSNAMFYYPRHTNVHKMAKELDDLFDTRWRSLEAKWNRGHTIVEPRCMPRGSAKNTRKLAPNGIEHPLCGLRRSSAEEMQKLREQILEGIKGKDFSAVARSFIGARSAKTTNGVQQSERKMSHKRGADSGHRSISGSAANVNTPLNLVTSKCGLCSERSLGQTHLDTSRKDYDGKSRSSSQMSKSDVASDGSARALAQERICSLNEPASGEDCPPLVDVQLSPKMALRAANLRSRYAKIILKANTFLAHVTAVQGDKADLVLLQKEKESLNRQQREEKFKTEAAPKPELPKQPHMERTVEIDDNLVSLKDLNDVLRGRWSDTDPAVVLGPIGGIHVGNVLQRMGLSLKDDSTLNGDIEEGERTS